MKSTWTLISLVFCLITGCSSKNENPSPTPEAAVGLMYRTLYEKGANKSSLDTPQKFYSERLSELIKLDQDQQKATGELGLLSADPLCECQDASDFEIKKISATERKLESAKVLVEFRFASTSRSIELSLSEPHRNWRINDVKTPEIESLYLFLANGLRATAPNPALPTAPAH